MVHCIMKMFKELSSLVRTTFNSSLISLITEDFFSGLKISFNRDIVIKGWVGASSETEQFPVFGSFKTLKSAMILYI